MFGIKYHIILLNRKKKISSVSLMHKEKRFHTTIFKIEVKFT